MIDGNGSAGSEIIDPILLGDAYNDDGNLDSKDNQEILNDIMGLQRFQATLNQPIDSSTSPAGEQGNLMNYNFKAGGRHQTR